MGTSESPAGMRRLLAFADQLGLEIHQLSVQIEVLNLSWRELTGSEHGYLVSNSLERLPMEMRKSVLVTAIDHVVTTKFRGLPWSKDEWEKRAKSSPGVSLAALVDQFVAEVSPTANHQIYTNALANARDMVKRDRSSVYGHLTWNQRPCTVERHNSTIKFHARLWQYDAVSTHRHRDALIGLEVVTGVAAGWTARDAAMNGGHVLRALHRLKEVKRVATTSALIPSVRPFKNGRLDVTFVSEALAGKVEQALRGEQL